MLERGLVLQMVRHHRVCWRGVRIWSVLIATFLIFIVVRLLLAHEVFWTFVFVRTAILEHVSKSSPQLDKSRGRRVPIRKRSSRRHKVDQAEQTRTEKCTF